MTLASVFEKAIKEHCKGNEYLNDIKGIKVLSVEYKEEIKCNFYDRPGLILTKYEATCKMAAKKYDNNRVKFQINVYSDGSDIGVYFDGTFYERA